MRAKGTGVSSFRRVDDGRARAGDRGSKAKNREVITWHTAVLAKCWRVRSITGSGEQEGRLKVRVMSWRVQD